MDWEYGHHKSFILAEGVIYNYNSAHPNGVPRSRVCTNEILCSTPHRHEQQFSGECVCRVIMKHLPQPLKTSMSTSISIVPCIGVII